MSSTSALWRGGDAFLAAAVAIAFTTGLLLALRYEPSSSVGGSVPVLYHAETAVLDASGDTLFRAGEWAVLDSVPLHRGALRRIGDSTLRWNAALLSHALLVQEPAGAVLVAIHSTAASCAVVGAAALLVASMLCRQQHSRWQQAGQVALVVVLLVVSWLGTTLPCDARAVDAYRIGRSLLVENLPAVGDLLARVLPAELVAARLYALHAMWGALAVGGLWWLVHRRQQRDWLAFGVMALCVVAIGIVVGVLSPPAIVQSRSVPIWHLGVPYWLLHYLPMDATMLIVVVWWAVVLWGAVSSQRAVRRIGAMVLVLWFVGGAAVTLLER